MSTSHLAGDLIIRRSDTDGLNKIRLLCRTGSGFVSGKHQAVPTGRSPDVPSVLTLVSHMTKVAEHLLQESGQMAESYGMSE